MYYNELREKITAHYNNELEKNTFRSQGGDRWRLFEGLARKSFFDAFDAGGDQGITDGRQSNPSRRGAPASLFGNNKEVKNIGN